MKLISFNVNGIRAIIQKDFYNDMFAQEADVYCFQETKATVEQVYAALDDFKGYHIYANEADKKGYSGTAVVSKTQPMSITFDMGVEEHDREGRVICLEYHQFFLVNVYVPNSGSDLKRLGYRQTWDKDFLNYLKKLEQRKPVIICGDFNVAYQSIDLARPKENYNKSAGHMQEEIDGMTNFLSSGLVDSFRHKYPTDIKYSWWSYRAGARPKNIGWRIDYFLISNSIIDHMDDAFILNEVHGSDHCPVGIKLKI